MGLIRNLIDDLLDEAKRHTRYEARRGIRKVANDKFQKLREKFAKRTKPMIDRYVEHHPTKSRLAAQEEVAKAAAKVAEELANKPLEEIVVAPPVVAEVELHRRLEL